MTLVVGDSTDELECGGNLGARGRDRRSARPRERIVGPGAGTPCSPSSLMAIIEEAPAESSSEQETVSVTPASPESAAIQVSRSLGSRLGA